MAIQITTLNNAATVAKTFTEISKDRTSSEWLNTTDVATMDNRIIIRQSLSAPKNGARVRRTLVQIKLVKPVSGSTEKEEATFNCTFTAPEGSVTITDTDLQDLAFFARNFLGTANVSALRRGEV